MLEQNRITPNCVIRIPASTTYSTAGEKLMGRQSANESFLRAWLQYSGHENFCCLARSRDEAQTFARIGKELVPDDRRVYRWLSHQNIHKVSEVGTLYLPGPQVADMAWIRRRNQHCKENDFSLVGMTHTTCELTIQDALADMLSAPVHPWDAQICPSQSVHRMVEQLLQDEASWLRERFGSACQITMPQLPIIPIGLHCDDFDLPATEHEQLRSEWRKRWAVADDEVVALYMGRLDLRTKANLFPMFDALERAASKIKSKHVRLVLVLAGWFSNEWNEKTIREGLPKACPSLRVIIEDGRPKDARRGVWHGADLFTSLVDNIQETFGITPIEAMATGLPVVVSDYDGYRESIRDGIDGFHVRTWQPQAGAAIDWLDQFSDNTMGYGQYVAKVSALIGIDVEQAADIYARLALDPQLRKKLGASGRQRARQVYDWPQLMSSYRQLFEELAVIRKGATVAPWWDRAPSQTPSWGARYPRKSDPFHSFAHYPTATIDANTRLRFQTVDGLTQNSPLEMLHMHLERPVYDNLVSGKTLTLDFLEHIIAQLAHSNSSVSVATLLASAAREEDETARLYLERQIGWLIKTGLVVVSN